MPLNYKIDVLAALKDKGYSSYRLVNEKIFGNGSVQKLRHGEMLGIEGIATLCDLLNCQPGDLLEFVKDSPDTEPDASTEQAE